MRDGGMKLHMQGGKRQDSGNRCGRRLRWMPILERLIVCTGIPQKTSRVCTAPQAHVGIYGSCPSQGTCCCLWFVLLPQTMLTQKVHVDIHDSCHCWRPGGHLWSVLSLEVIFISVVHFDVYGLCCNLRPC